MADEFLENKPTLALTEGEEENQSSTISGAKRGGLRGQFVDANIRSVGSYNSYLKQKQVDRLDPVAKAKLDSMLLDID